MTGVVYVLDDDADLAGSVTRFLRRNQFSAEPFVSPSELLDAYRVEPANCVVTDVMMPDMDGFEFAQRLREQDACTSLVFMTGMPTTRDAVDSIRIFGGIDYIAKPLDEVRLLQAVIEGVAWSDQRRAELAKLKALSMREREVLALLGRGLQNKEIASALGLSIRTVEDHRAAIVRKTGAKTLSEIITLAEALG